MVEEEFHVVINCPQCGVPCDAWLTDVPRPDLEAETARDAENIEDIDLDCETCGHNFEVTIRAALLAWDAYLTDDPSQAGTVEHIDYRYDDWMDEMEPEPHPRAIFDQAIGEWMHLLDEIADKRSGAAGTNRMLLVQLFSILEAYLSDATIKLAHDDPAVARGVVIWHPELKAQQVSLTKVASEPDLVRDVVIARLRKTQFHRFEFVNGMLRAAIGHFLLPKEKTDRDMVLKSVQVRHDCAHRNGRDAEGNIIDTITTQYLSGLAARFMDMVANLATKIDEIDTERRKEMLDDLDDLPFPLDASPEETRP